MKLHRDIFKSYDVRGRYPDELDAEGAGRVGAAFVAFLGSRPAQPIIVLGRDARPSSKPLASAVREALISSGARVLDIGLATTPLFYFAINRFRAGGGIMVTASHNPPEFNGLKICGKEAAAVGLDSGLADIRDAALRGEEVRREGGGAEDAEALDAYVKFLASQVSCARPLAVTIDAGNGMAGLVLEKLLPKMPELQTRKLYFSIDGTFPNHLANPVLEETLGSLKRDLIAHPADIGIAFDADADRVGFLAPDGSLVGANSIFSVLVRDALHRAPRDTKKVLYAANMSRFVPETIREYGGTPVRVKIGHANINTAMRSEGAILGGELSGHYFFREFFGRDDAVLAMLRVMRMLSEAASLEDLVAPFVGRYVQSGEMNFRVQEKEETLRRVEGRFRNGRVDRLDGLTVEYDDWWFNLRPSNTENLLRLNVEAESRERLDEVSRRLRDLIGGAQE